MLLAEGTTVPSSAVLQVLTPHCVCLCPAELTTDRQLLALFPGRVGGEKTSFLLPHGLGTRLRQLVHLWQRAVARWVPY